MRLTKKGDLALSTNAIVVLIIAVIILGLIITFITQAFDDVSNEFTSFSEIPTPSTPSSGEPITQRGALSINAGDTFTWKLLVYNPTDTAREVTVGITCLNANVVATPGLKGFSQTVGARDISSVYEITGTIARNAPPGAQTCRLVANATAVTSGPAAGPIATRDITLTVRE